MTTSQSTRPIRKGSWQFEYQQENFRRDLLESGKKLCENHGCSNAASHIAEGGTSVNFACDDCVKLIPECNILKSVILAGSWWTNGEHDVQVTRVTKTDVYYTCADAVGMCEVWYFRENFAPGKSTKGKV